MIPALVATAGVLVVVAAVLWERRRADLALRSRVRREVVVTLTSGPAFSGVLFDSDAVCCVLRDAVGLNSDKPVPVDGELLLRWSDIAYVQLP